MIGFTISTDNKTNKTVLFDPWLGKSPNYNYNNVANVPGLTDDIMAGVGKNGNINTGSPQIAVGHNSKLGPTVIWHTTGGYTPNEAHLGLGGGRSSTGQIGHKYSK